MRLDIHLDIRCNSDGSLILRYIRELSPCYYDEDDVNYKEYTERKTKIFKGNYTVINSNEDDKFQVLLFKFNTEELIIEDYIDVNNKIDDHNLCNKDNRPMIMKYSEIKDVSGKETECVLKWEKTDEKWKCRVKLENTDVICE